MFPKVSGAPFGVKITKGFLGIGGPVPCSSAARLWELWLCHPSVGTVVHWGHIDLRWIPEATEYQPVWKTGLG